MPLDIPKRMSDHSADELIVLSDDEAFDYQQKQGRDSASALSGADFEALRHFSGSDPATKTPENPRFGRLASLRSPDDSAQFRGRKRALASSDLSAKRRDEGLFLEPSDTSDMLDFAAADENQATVSIANIPEAQSSPQSALQGAPENGTSGPNSDPRHDMYANSGEIVVISDDESIPENDGGRKDERVFLSDAEPRVTSDDELYHDAAAELQQNGQERAGSEDAVGKLEKNGGAHLGQDLARDLVLNSGMSSDTNGNSSGQGPKSVPEHQPDLYSNNIGSTVVQLDDDSDEEIAVLSKEEAERIASFKKSSFENRKAIQTEQTPPAFNQTAPPLFNQPVPVFHAGANSQISPFSSPQDLKIRDYFMRSSLGQLQTQQHQLESKLGAVEATIQARREEVQTARNEISALPFDSPTLKRELTLRISQLVGQADYFLSQSKSFRKYIAILESVKNFRLSPQANNQYPSNQGMLAANMHNNVIDVESESNVNPYMVRPANPDHVHLESLFKDLYREEKVEGMAPTPDSLSINLLDHQRRGLFWLLEKEKAKQGCILADDMGLGKTVQTIAVMMANRSLNPTCKTTLIVGPVSLLRQWYAEFQAKIKPGNSLSVALYHGQERRHLDTFRKMAKYDVILTSYTTLASEFKQHFAMEMEKALVTKGQNVLPLRGTGGQNYMSPFFSNESNFYRIVLDEAQYVKNKLSQASKAVACLRGVHRLCLTGTPMQNSIDELYPILRFLEARPYDNESKFKKDISVPLKATDDDRVDDYDRNSSMVKLRAVLSAVMLRRTKDSKVDGKPLVQLPEKTVSQVFVKMENNELESYKALESGIQKKARKLMASTEKAGNGSILTLLLRLRQACIHQLLVEVGELNTHENSDSFKGTNWVQMFNRVRTLKQEVIQTVTTQVEPTYDREGREPGERDEIQLTCPMCFDVVSEDSIVILANCGHMVCDGCVENLFGEQKEASCMSCDAIAAVGDTIEYGIFAKVAHEGLNFESLERFYGMTNTKKSTNSDKVSFLIRRDGGFTPSAKMERTLDLIKEITDNTSDEKIIVFSHFTVTFDLMGHALRSDNIEFLRYDGSMNIEEKNRTISEFYQGTPRVLLISLKAGNVGLTLTCASHVVIMDPFWNPYVEDQAMDRAHRFGQERPVKVYRLLIRDSVEDRIMDLQQRKKELIGSALDENALKSSSHLGRRELGYLFGLNSLQ